MTSKARKILVVISVVLLTSLCALSYFNRFDKNQSEVIALSQQQTRTPSGTAYWQKGTGAENIVFLHGLFGTKYSFQDLSQLLPGDVHLWALDIKGFGFTERSGDFSLSAQVNQLNQFLNENNIHNAVLVGHSMGGKVVQAYAMLHPENVKHLILIDSGDFFAMEKGHNHPAFSLLYSKTGLWLASKITGRLLIKSVLKDVYVDRSKIKEQAVNEYGYPFLLPEFWQSLPAVMTPEKDEWLSNIKAKIPLSQTPVSIIWGEEDARLPLAQGRRIAAEYKHSRLFTVPNVGHNPHEENPSAVASLFNQILGTIREQK